MKRRRKANGHGVLPWVDESPGPVCGKVVPYRCDTCGVVVKRVVPPCRSIVNAYPCGQPLTLGEPRSYCTGTLELVEDA
jgi:hypothetical protein